MYEDINIALDASTGSATVELIRALMGAPPELRYLILITNFLTLVHQASETYVTHSRHSMYFLLPSLCDIRSNSNKSQLTSTLSQQSFRAVNTKLSKSLANAQFKRELDVREDGDTSSQGQDTSAGEDSGIAASETSASNNQPQQGTQQYSATSPTSPERYAERRRTCQGLVCEGLLLLLRDALRVLPDSGVAPVLHRVIRAELLLVLANDPDARVRTALVKLVQAYLQRASDEQINRFIKQRYFVHLANQVALYPGNEPLVVTLENLALKGPNLSSIPPILAMIPRAAATDLNVARPLVSFVTDLITKVK